jgi:hypothetical protein
VVEEVGEGLVVGWSVDGGAVGRRCDEDRAGGVPLEVDVVSVYVSVVVAAQHDEVG